MTASLVNARIEAVFRSHRGRVFAHLMGRLRDFDAVEDALQEAFVAALRHWPARGIPDRPAAWITTVARNAATSIHRREALADRTAAALAEPSLELELDAIADDAIGDDRLRLLFTCCHPALPAEGRIPLTLRTVCGLETPEIARLLLLRETAVAQRIVRAKQKIRTAGIAYELPRPEWLDDRTADVLACVYLLFTEGYASTSNDALIREPLCEEAIRLARLLARELPSRAEVRGLLALMLLHHARRHGRLDEAGDAIALDEQDRRLWDRATIEEGRTALHEALALGEPGPYQIEAAIAALHAEASAFETTDWPQVAGLYAELMRRAPSPAAAMAWAFTEGMADGADRGLALLDRLEREGALGQDVARIAAVRAELSWRAGLHDRAREAWAVAIAGARHPRWAAFLERRAARGR